MKAFEDNFWISQIDFRQGISVEHIREFVLLWEKLASVFLRQ